MLKVQVTSLSVPNDSRRRAYDNCERIGYVLSTVLLIGPQSNTKL